MRIDTAKQASELHERLMALQRDLNKVGYAPLKIANAHLLTVIEVETLPGGYLGQIIREHIHSEIKEVKRKICNL